MRMLTVLLVTLSALAGCQPAKMEIGPERPPLAGTIAHAEELDLALATEEAAAAADAEVKFPTGLAIAKLHKQYGRAALELDADDLRDWQSAAARHNRISSVQALTDEAVGSRLTLLALRNAAVQAGCDLLLVYAQDDQQCEGTNSASSVYWTIVGMYTAAGNDARHRTVMQGALLDSRTGAIIGVLGAKADIKDSFPMAVKQQRTDEVNRAAPAKAMRDFQDEFGRALERPLVVRP